MLVRGVIFLLVCFLINDNKSSTKNELLWQTDRKLQWNDFKGQPKYWSNFAAQTVTTIEQSYTCDADNFKLTLIAKFNKSKSWTKTSKSKRILAHEQKHFDLTELYARKMRKTYQELTAPCQMGTAALNKIYNDLFEELRQLQILYDVETDHGLKTKAQQQWDDFIALGLNKYSKYK